MTPEEHKKRHLELHRALDELFADFIEQHPTQGTFLRMPLQSLLTWSAAQIAGPDHPPQKESAPPPAIELERMEASAQDLGRTIADVLHERYQGKVRFCMLLASNDVGWFTYVSNIKRDSTIELLQEAVDKITKDPSGAGSLAP